MLALLAFALCELVAHAVTRARVPAPRDFRPAASFVRGAFQPGDLIVAAPGWADPLVREALGDLIDLKMAGRSDTAGYDRLWVVSIRGARAAETPRSPPEIERGFGRVRVQRYRLGTKSVAFDFVEQLPRAKVSVGGRDCPWRGLGPSRGGGLGVGALPPPQRFACEGARGTWVGSVVQERLELLPRYCVHAAPSAGGALRIAFEDVPLGERIVAYAGLYYEDERMREGGPVQMRVLVAGREAGTLVHADGEGWKRLQLATGGGTGEVAFEVSAPDVRRRGFCFAASTRSGSDHAGGKP